MSSNFLPVPAKISAVNKRNLLNMDSSHLIVFSWQLIFVLITGLPSASLEYIPESSLVSIKRCSDSNHEMPGYFACKLDNCNHWITFQNCPDDQVSTGEMNLATRMMFCNSTAGPAYTSTIGLVEKKACQNFIEQGSIFRCQYAVGECWFPFEVCDSGENKTKEMLNFNTKMCQLMVKPTDTPKNLTHPTDPPVSPLINSNAAIGHWKYIFIISFIPLIVKDFFWTR